MSHGAYGVACKGSSDQWRVFKICPPVWNFFSLLPYVFPIFQTKICSHYGLNSKVSNWVCFRIFVHMRSINTTWRQYKTSLSILGESDQQSILILVARTHLSDPPGESGSLSCSGESLIPSQIYCKDVISRLSICLWLRRSSIPCFFYNWIILSNIE